MQTMAKKLEYFLGGQRVALEFVWALDAANQVFMQHHIEFVQRSGALPGSGSASSHCCVSGAVAHLVTCDQYNLGVPPGAELPPRYLYQIEAAVSRNPRAPDYADLESLVGSSVNESGALILPGFAKHVAELQRAEAFTLQQRRQYHTEMSHLGGGGGSSGGRGGGDGSGRGRGGDGGGRGRDGGRGRSRDGGRGRGRGRDGGGSGGGADAAQSPG